MKTPTIRQLKQLAGILAGAYTCEKCNLPSLAAVEVADTYRPACKYHALKAEREGFTVIRAMPRNHDI